MDRRMSTSRNRIDSAHSKNICKNRPIALSAVNFSDPDFNLRTLTP